MNRGALFEALGATAYASGEEELCLKCSQEHDLGVVVLNQWLEIVLGRALLEAAGLLHIMKEASRTALSRIRSGQL